MDAVRLLNVMDAVGLSTDGPMWVHTKTKLVQYVCIVATNVLELLELLELLEQNKA